MLHAWSLSLTAPTSPHQRDADLLPQRRKPEEAEIPFNVHVSRGFRLIRQLTSYYGKSGSLDKVESKCGWQNLNQFIGNLRQEMILAPALMLRESFNLPLANAITRYPSKINHHSELLRGG